MRDLKHYKSSYRKQHIRGDQEAGCYHPKRTRQLQGKRRTRQRDS